MLTDLPWSETIESNELLEARQDGVAFVRLHRPQVRNALSVELLVALTEALERFDRDETIRVMVVTGGRQFFAAGADIGAMAGATSAEMATRPQLGCWQRLRQIRKPIVAAVNGFALGGGAELVWVCDLVVAGDSARFGQPEIALGLIPGGGATQRLPRSIGKARAMEMVLVGEPIAAREALDLGLINQVVPDDLVLTSADRVATRIAEKSLDATIAAKSAVLDAFDLPVVDGLDAERARFNALFDTPDTQEGLRAFLEKRPAQFGRNRS
ncbi:MAG: enoyl-CoA hydratase/isomerase family protein [Thermomicrobiales bacterium]|nr:enoyl-CoA hydratase/isomerase family protein [Thermomicrobiales bacterium]